MAPRRRGSPASWRTIAGDTAPSSASAGPKSTHAEANAPQRGPSGAAATSTAALSHGTASTQPPAAASQTKIAPGPRMRSA